MYIQVHNASSSKYIGVIHIHVSFTSTIVCH